MQKNQHFGSTGRSYRGQYLPENIKFALDIPPYGSSQISADSSYRLFRAYYIRASIRSMDHLNFLMLVARTYPCHPSDELLLRH